MKTYSTCLTIFLFIIQLNAQKFNNQPILQNDENSKVGMLERRSTDFDILFKEDLAKSSLIQKSKVLFVNLNASGTNDGTSWTNAFNNLQTAIDNSTTNDQIWVAQGTYKPEIINSPADSNFFIVNKELEIYGGFDGAEILLEERDWKNNVTILSGDINGDDTDDNFTLNKSDNTVHVITGNNFIIDGFEISYGTTRQGIVPKSGYHAWYGGGIYCRGVKIKNCRFRQNYAFFGGGLYSSYGSNADIVNCEFSHNKATKFGAGLVVGNMNANLLTCKFKGNSIVDPKGLGAGAFLFQNEYAYSDNYKIKIKNCEFKTNTSQYGGGLMFNNFHQGSKLIIDSCSFLSNSTFGQKGYGGAININNFNTNPKNKKHTLDVIVKNSYFDANAAYEGSVLRFIQYIDSASLTFDNNIVKNNFNDYDAPLGFACTNNSKLNIDIKSSKFESNKSTVYGGGIVFNNAQKTRGLNYSIDDCQFINNNGGNYGGAIASFNTQGGLGPKGIITNSTFESNKATISCGAISSNNEDITINNCSFNKNSANKSGSALCLSTYSSQEGISHLSNNTFTDNITTEKVDTADHNWINNGTVEIWSKGIQTAFLDSCDFSFNKSSGVGGAITIINQDSLLVNIQDCNFTENKSEIFGGAIFGVSHNQEDNLPRVNMDGNIFHKNKSTVAGALFFKRVIADLQNTKITENNSTKSSGGFSLSNGIYNLKKCTFRMNTAETFGGGLNTYQSNLKSEFNSIFNIDSCKFVENKAAQAGAGMMYSAYFGKSFLNVNNCQFNSNTADSEGGGLYTQASSNSDFKIGNVKITNSSFYYNIATNSGGALANVLRKDTLNVVIDNCIFEGNTTLNDNAGTGGAGVFNVGRSKTGELNYIIQNTLFKENTTQGISAGVWNTSTSSSKNGPNGIIENCQFIKNDAKYCCGGIGAAFDESIIKGCLFDGNKTKGLHPSLKGGGGAGFILNDNIEIYNSIFRNNQSDIEGSALHIDLDKKFKIENVLIHNNSGKSALYTDSEVKLNNVSMIDNPIGLLVTSKAKLSLQNSIFDNATNFKGDGSIITLGSNISTDQTMSSFLIGLGTYSDYNNTDPQIDSEFIPENASICIDAGNPTGLNTNFDVKGNKRIQGNAVDIGAIESPFSTAVLDAIWDSEALMVFPNPVEDVLKFELKKDNTKELKVSIFNNIGQLILRTDNLKRFNKNHFSLNLSTIQKGTYFIIVSTNQESFVQKFIKI